MLPLPTKQVIDHCKAEVRHRSRDWYRLCLAFVRLMLGVGPKDNAAIDEWNAAKIKHGPDPKPPAGVPVFLAGGKATKLHPQGCGHVMLSAGDGYVFTTDFRRVGYVDRVLLADVIRIWGMRYLGWTEDMNGVRVWAPPAKPKPKPSPKPTAHFTKYQPVTADGHTHGAYATKARAFEIADPLLDQSDVTIRRV